MVSEVVLRDVLADLDHLGRQVEALQQLVDGLRAHARVELVAVLLDRVEVHLVGEQLAALHRVMPGSITTKASKYSTRSISRTLDQA